MTKVKLKYWAKNKFLLSGLCFLVWMLFFDRNDLTLQWQRVNELERLENSEKALTQLISDTRKELDLLKTNPSTLEKYAREKYMMKKDNEDLFTITSGTKMVK